MNLEHVFENSTGSRRRFLGQTAAAVASTGLLASSWTAGANRLFAEEKPVADKAFSPPTSRSWAMFRHDAEQRGIAGCTLANNPQLLWKRKTIDGVVAAAAIVGEHAYVGELNGQLHCLRLSDGAPVWTYLSLDDKDPEKFKPGFKSSPTVTADTVYAGDEDGVVHAVDRKTGKQRWTFKTGGEIAGGAAIVGENVVVGSHDNFLYCLRAKDRELVWKYQTQERVNCSTAISDGFTFIAGCDEHLRVIDLRDGKQKYVVALGSPLIASPALYGDMLYVGTYKGEVVAIEWKKEKIVWKYFDPDRDMPYHASACVLKDRVVVGGRDRLFHAIDRLTGKRLWAFPARAKIDSSAAVVGDRAFFGSTDRNLYGVSLTTGKQVWKFNAGQDVTAGIAIGEDHLVVGAEGPGGFIYCFGKK